MAKRTPESLFENIAQDSEVLEIFRHHSMRVMYLSSMLAKKVGHYDEDLRVAAFLHDIGKIGIAKEILLKAGRLNTIEMTVIEAHCHMGNVIVRKELGKTRAAEFIRDHHEDWNGKGYPRRLIGEEISVQGRIIRICDSFDTMTYDVRNYKQSKMTYEEAYEELKKCSWTQFDGNLVDTFISMLIELELPEAWYDNYDSKFFEKLYHEIESPEDIL